MPPLEIDPLTGRVISPYGLRRPRLNGTLRAAPATGLAFPGEEPWTPITERDLPAEQAPEEPRPVAPPDPTPSASIPTPSPGVLAAPAPSEPATPAAPSSPPPGINYGRNIGLLARRDALLGGTQQELEQASAERAQAVGQPLYNPARPGANSEMPGWDQGLAPSTGVIGGGQIPGSVVADPTLVARLNVENTSATDPPSLDGGDEAPTSSGQPPAPGVPPVQAPVGNPAASADLGGSQAPRGPLGLSSNAWFGLASGLLGSRNMAEGMSRGLANLNEATRQDQADVVRREDLQNRREDRRDARTDRRDNMARQARADAELAAYRRATLAQGDRRISAVEARGERGPQTPYSSLGTFRAEDGSTVTQRFNRSTGAQEFLDQGGQVIPPERVAGMRLTRVQDTGEGAAASTTARHDVTNSETVFQEAQAARTLRTSIANARRVLQEDPNITGPDWQTRGTNYLAEALGIPMGQRTPENIAMMRQALQSGQMQTLMQIAPSLRPMSNVDLQAIAQMSPSMMTNPRTLGAWLAQMDAAAERAERRSGALATAFGDPAQRAAILRSGGVAAWRERYDAEEASRSRPNGVPRPDVQPGTNQQGQREWQRPPAQSREIGRVYQTPQGPMRWMGGGWAPAQ